VGGVEDAPIEGPDRLETEWEAGGVLDVRVGARALTLSPLLVLGVEPTWGRRND
jgi:hypothetical protein